MKRYVIVHHDDRPVALVAVDSALDNSAALEVAYVGSQNLRGSWSRPAQFEFDGEVVENPDFNENVMVLQDLPEVDGQVYGLRSSMVGDVFVLDGRSYRVGHLGFKPVDNE